ncbi:MAG: type II toxin-antitoxin system ParD family antitoxin [Hyphomonadaceae bacterium]|nr:type II toxin-antitoxin system ParD family antitoxin [Hyphomonadaceae bacterium]
MLILMQIDLPPALAAFIHDLVAQGRYADEAEVVRDAIRRMAERDRDPETGLHITALRAELEAAEAGPRSSASVMDIFGRVASSVRAAAK